MLPSRAFRNTGIPPVLRSLITLHPSLPSTIAVQLRFKLGVLPGTVPQAQTPGASSAPFSTSSSSWTNEIQSKTSSSPNSASISQSHDAVVPPLSGPSSESELPAQSQTPNTTTSQPLPERIEPRLSLTFTCTVPNCGERSTHQFSKQAYEKGIVLVQCPGCKNRHLIADHLGWFKEGTNGGKMPTVEDILRQKGEKVQKGVVTWAGGDLEVTE
ncbi:DNL zinc finger-domain-containing protein [Gymnopilus junonius]|uniref:DNL zinc finger-domain-containing protein n=1 Tax=Gymnopilus junonius TaxID=109634 RepID=A0A9P5NNQ4_GYMJU|nr:DNL zinc finger-domain-containing protein [Gymnopilus junonius]